MSSQPGPVSPKQGQSTTSSATDGLPDLNKIPIDQQELIKQPIADKNAADRLALRKQIEGSADLDTLVKQELLLSFSRSDSSTQDIAKRFADAIDPEGATFKNLKQKRDNIKLIQDTPGIDKQTMLTGGYASPGKTVLTGGGGR